jgi:hypothetical protein
MNKASLLTWRSCWCSASCSCCIKSIGRQILVRCIWYFWYLARNPKQMHEHLLRMICSWATQPRPYAYGTLYKHNHCWAHNALGLHLGLNQTVQFFIGVWLLGTLKIEIKNILKWIIACGFMKHEKPRVKISRPRARSASTIEILVDTIRVTCIHPCLSVQCWRSGEALEKWCSRAPYPHNNQKYKKIETWGWKGWDTEV